MGNIIVTGGAGFIGSHFLDLLDKKIESKIYVLDNLNYASNIQNVPKGSKFEFVWCDISNEDHVNYIFQKLKPNKVFHFAAESHVDNSIRNYRPFLEVNVIGTINLMNASLSVGVDKFHFISTDEVYGSLNYEDKELFKETTPIDPRNPYSASKAAAEHYVKTWHNTYQLPFLITSSSNNYGPRQHYEKLIPKLITNSLNNKITYLYGGGHQIRDWLFVSDHCQAIWQLDQKNIINEKFNIGGDCELQNIILCKKVLDILDKSYDLLQPSYEDNIINSSRPGQDQRYGTDFSKITKFIGWKPTVEFDLALESTVRWYYDKVVE